jgi:hypothetical protein
MEMAYVADPVYGGKLAGVFDRMLCDMYACVRHRKHLMKQLIARRLLRRGEGGGTVAILAIGSASGREWLELDDELGSRREARRRVALTCLDWDEEALAFARRRLVTNRLLRTVEYLRIGLFSFAQVVRTGNWPVRQHAFDLVYGLGIADYYRDATLGDIIRAGLRLLAPGGAVQPPGQGLVHGVDVRSPIGSGVQGTGRCNARAAR